VIAPGTALRKPLARRHPPRHPCRAGVARTNTLTCVNAALLKPSSLTRNGPGELPPEPAEARSVVHAQAHPDVVHDRTPVTLSPDATANDACRWQERRVAR
jgi:hypothetical protein